jgi:hypothetical protein
VNGFRLLKIAVLAPLSVIPACGDDGPSEATSFTATLSGANEVPAVTTTATGSATLSVSGTAITYTVNVTDLQNDALVAHIHVAAAGANGPVRLNLCGTGTPEPACSTAPTGVLATGTNGTIVPPGAITFDSLLSAMRTGGAYVNVHTSANQGGEIRGQIVAN